MHSCFKIDLGLIKLSNDLCLISMSESKSIFGDCHGMAHIWARIQAFDRVFKIRTVQTCSYSPTKPKK